MPKAEPYFRPHPDVLHTQLDDAEAVLLGLETGRYYSLNETGIQIWAALQAGASLSDIAEALEQEYDITHEEATAHVSAYLEELLQESLIVKEESR